ncbi:MAG: hypothetical protein P8Y03_28640, partial [Anaerolineales bacterium]
SLIQTERKRNMYCPECKCEYVGWKGRCPVCKAVLLREKPAIAESTEQAIPYDKLVDLVKERGGQISIDLSTTSVSMKRGTRFPYIGRGYAWMKRIQSVDGDIDVELTTTEVGTERRWEFPYFGFGYAWTKQVQGHIVGNECNLRATKVAKERKLRFPYLGYGYAWVQEMSGKCGDRLKVELSITEVDKERKWRFPYFGYGFAWAGKGKLRLTLD